MQQYLNHPEYAAIGTKIKRRSAVITVVSVLAVIFALSFCLPSEMIVMGDVVKTEGAHPVVTVLIIIGIVIASLIALAVAAMPSVSSLDTECDPVKHLCINAELGGKNIESIFANDLFLLGDFENSLSYSKHLLNSKNKIMRYNGYFLKARNEYFLGDFEALKATAADFFKFYENDTKKPYPKVLTSYHDAVSLYLALADDNREQIEALYKKLALANTQSKAAIGSYNYIKGVAAHRLSLKNEAVHHFMTVKENCEKTVLATLANEFLSK